MQGSVHGGSLEGWNPGARGDGLSAIASGPASARLRWRAPRRARTAEISRDAHVLDVVGARAGRWTDHLLWPATAYHYEIRFADRRGRFAGRAGANVQTAPRTGPPARPFAATDWLNSPVAPDAGLDPASALIAARAIAAHAGGANLANSAFWGTPIAYADPSSTPYRVHCTAFFCDRPSPRQRIPRYAASAQGVDRHLVVLGPKRRAELDLWDAAHDAAGGWQAGTQWRTRTDRSAANCARRQRGCGGANVAGFALTAGLVRPEEIAAGRIDHALVITTPDTRRNAVACPAAGTDGKHDDPTAIRMGAHVQLSPSLDLSQLNLASWKLVIARALQTYGAYVADTGGSLSVRAESTALRGYDAWALAGVPAGDPSLADLPWASVRVLHSHDC